MKKIYIVKSYFGHHSDNRCKIECACSNLFLAEKQKKEIEDYYKEEKPFPFDWCTEEQFLKIPMQRITDKDWKEYEAWNDWIYQEFICCHIEEIDYY